MKKKYKKPAIIIGAILLVLTIIVLLVNLRGISGSEYDVESAEIRDVLTYYSFSGNIDSKNKQEVTASMGNLSIDSINVKKGDFVHIGDTLYTLDAIDAQNNLAVAQASLELAQINLQKAQEPTALTAVTIAFNDAKSNLERMSILYENGAISQVEFKGAQTQYSNAKANLEQAESNLKSGIESARAQYNQSKASLDNAQHSLKNRKITAKVDGIVADVYVDENATLNMGEPIMDIVDYNSLFVEIKVDEFAMSAITERKEVEVYITALEKKIKGVIANISAQAKKVGDLSYFIAEVEVKHEKDLRIGLSSEIKIPNIAEFGVVTISTNALQFDVANNPFVYIGSKSRPERKDVKIGANDGKIVQIIEGLNDGDSVLVPRTLNDMMMFDPSGPPQFNERSNGNE